MSKVSITKSKLDRLANVISAKSGESIPLTIDEMEDAVRNIHPNLTSKTITENNSTYYAQDDDVDGYSSVTVAVDSIDCPKFTIIYGEQGIEEITCDKTFEQCRNYIYDDTYNVVVEVDNSTGGATVGNFYNNVIYYNTMMGTYPIADLIIKYYSDDHIEWEENPISYRDSNNLTVSGPTVTAPNGYYPSDANATVANGSAATPATTITANPTISVGSNGLITSNVSGSQSITPTVSEGYVTSGTAGTVSVTGTNTSQLSTQAAKTVTPTESEQTAVAAGKYTTGAVKVGAISSTYVGSGIDQNDSTDLTVSGATVTAPAGYYAQAASKSVASGSATTPATTITATPTISVGSDGLITATASATKSVTPTVSAGYVSSGSAGTITVSGSQTSQLSTQAGKTVTPTESEQTAVAAGKYTTGAVKVGAISSTYVGSGIAQRDSTDLTASGATVTVPAGYYSAQASKAVASGTAGTPTATKGTVSNHSVSVTPSVTNSAGYITGGTKNGTAVTVSASELVSGTYSVTSSGTKDVTNYASASVPAGTEGTPTATKSAVSNHAVSVTPSVTNSAGYITGSTKTGTAVTVSASELVDGNLSITANGTNIDVTNYSTVSVNVPTGGVTQDQDGFIVLPPDGSGGGSGTSSPAQKKQINFIDYDGTILYSYTKTEWQNVSALPSNPTHSGLTSQGWNWTKAQIDAQLTSAPNADVWVGQMYITTSGDTKIDVRFADSARLSPILSICVNGTITVDWGDNTTADAVTGTSLTTRQDVSHTYASVGDYTITIHVVSGSFRFYSSSSSYQLLRKNTTQNENRVYANCVQAVWLGSGTTIIGINAFYNCHSLASITIPSGVTSIEINAFYNCYSLASITIPSTVTSIGDYTFENCYSLASITIPSGVTSIGYSAFYNCRNLASITIPSGVTSIGSYMFAYCYSLASITIPSTVTSIETYAFAYCGSLASITIPSGVTSIETYAFYDCSGIAEYHIKATTPPTLGGTNSFGNIVSDCVIYVPSASLSDYQTASNWSTYASYMQGE